MIIGISHVTSVGIIGQRLCIENEKGSHFYEVLHLSQSVFFLIIMDHMIINQEKKWHTPVSNIRLSQTKKKK